MPSLKELTDQIALFYLDRPAMEENNKDKRLATLLAAEGRELRERLRINHGEVEVNLLALYEIADIVIFAISLLEKLGEDPNEISAEFEPEQSQLQMLLTMGTSIGSIAMWAKDGQPREVIKQEVMDVAQYGLKLIYSLGVNPIAVCLEKVGHNISRYPAKRFGKGHDYEAQREKCKDLAAEYRLEELFYSPFRPGEENPVYKISS